MLSVTCWTPSDALAYPCLTVHYTVAVCDSYLQLWLFVVCLLQDSIIRNMCIRSIHELRTRISIIRNMCIRSIHELRTRHKLRQEGLCFALAEIFYFENPPLLLFLRMRTVVDFIKDIKEATPANLRLYQLPRDHGYRLPHGHEPLPRAFTSLQRIQSPLSLYVPAAVSFPIYRILSFLSMFLRSCLRGGIILK